MMYHYQAQSYGIGILLAICEKYWIEYGGVSGVSSHYIEGTFKAFNNGSVSVYNPFNSLNVNYLQCTSVPSVHYTLDKRKTITLSYDGSEKMFTQGNRIAVRNSSGSRDLELEKEFSSFDLIRVGSHIYYRGILNKGFNIVDSHLSSYALTQRWGYHVTN